MKKLLTALLVLMACQTARAASSIRYVQISSNTLTRQLGTSKIAKIDVSTATVSSFTVTSQTFSGDGTTQTTAYPGSNGVILDQATLQSGATFYVSSGTVVALRTGSLVSSGTVTLGGASNSVTISTNIVFNPTTAGIFGTTTNDSACTGCVGEIITSNTPYATAVGVTAGSVVSVGTATLTAGEWLVITQGALKSTNAGTSITNPITATSLTANTRPGTNTFMVPDASGQITWDTVIAALVPGNNQQLMIATVVSVVKLNTTTPVYAVAGGGFSVSTCSAFGSITAIRIR